MLNELEHQWYAPAVCADCKERLGWVGVNEALKEYTFELHGVHPECPALPEELKGKNFIIEKDT